MNDHVLTLSMALSDNERTRPIIPVIKGLPSLTDADEALWLIGIGAV
jgi:hypothetical protein